MRCSGKTTVLLILLVYVILKLAMQSVYLVDVKSNCVSNILGIIIYSVLLSITLTMYDSTPDYNEHAQFITVLRHAQCCQIDLAMYMICIVHLYIQETVLFNGDLLIHPEVLAHGQTYDCSVHLQEDNVTVHYRSYWIDMEHGMTIVDSSSSAIVTEK